MYEWKKWKLLDKKSASIPTEKCNCNNGCPYFEESVENAIRKELPSTSCSTTSRHFIAIQTISSVLSSFKRNFELGCIWSKKKFTFIQYTLSNVSLWTTKKSGRKIAFAGINSLQQTTNNKSKTWTASRKLKTSIFHILSLFVHVFFWLRFLKKKSMF